MQNTVLDHLQQMLPQATAILVIIILGCLGAFLGMLAYLLLTGWKFNFRRKR